MSVRLLPMGIVLGLLLIEFAVLGIVRRTTIGGWRKGCDGAFANTNIFADPDFDALVSEGTREGGRF